MNENLYVLFMILPCLTCLGFAGYLAVIGSYGFSALFLFAGVVMLPTKISTITKNKKNTD